MEEKIQEKINALVEYIISKPVEAITPSDYGILSTELKDARFRREQGDSNDKFVKLLASLAPAVSAPADTRPVTPAARAVKK